MKAMSPIHAILPTRNQRLAGKKYHRCTFHAHVHSSHAALLPVFFVIPVVSPGQRFLPDQCRCPVPRPLAQFPGRCLPLAQLVPLLSVGHRLYAILFTLKRFCQCIQDHIYTICSGNIFEFQLVTSIPC